MENTILENKENIENIVLENGNKNENKNKRNIFISIIILLFVFIAIIFSSIYFFQIKLIKYNNSYIISANVTEDYILDHSEKNKFTFIENDKENVYKINDLGIDCEIINIDNIIYIPYIDADSIIVKYKDINAKEKLKTLNEDRRFDEYALMYIKNKTIYIKDEKQGDQLNIDKLYNDIIKNLNNGVYTIVLEDYYLKLENKNGIAEELFKEKEKFENFNITYTNGYSIKGQDLIDYILIENNKIIFNEELKKECYKHIDKLLERNLLSYDTIGKTWDFVTPNGEEIKVKGGTYGDFFSSDKEAEYIIEKFKKLESEENREPIKTQDLPDKIPNTYVAVSLTEQHMWFYKDNELILESDVVTGTAGSHDTPRGVYFISEMKDGKYLTGADYRTWVNRWMRLTNRGHGLHDAYWRGKFGNNIYTYDGSHGCVNLPKNIAYELYDLVKLKDCVVIY